VPAASVAPVVAAPMLAPPVIVAPVASAKLADAAAAREDDLYQRAHALHFEKRDMASSLAAWDAYLEAEPNGRFVPEARYNRASA